MSEQNSVLFVHLDQTQAAALEASLASQAVKILRAQNCREAGSILAGPEPPQLVLTDTSLPDGSWADVVALARKSHVPINVIVVARLVNTRFYVEVIEAGAYDFIASPFQPYELGYVLNCALQNALERREAQARLEQAAQRELFPGALNSPRTALPASGAAAALRAAHKSL